MEGLGAPCSAVGPLSFGAKTLMCHRMCRQSLAPPSSVLRLMAALISAAFTAGASHAADIVDQRNHVLSLAAPAKRVILLPMPAASTYIAVDGTEQHIVGMNPSSAVAMENGILGRLFPGFRNIATNVTRGAGVAPNVESILALAPDAVFQWVTGGEAAIESLDRAGLPMIGMRYGGQRDMEESIVIMGQIAGKQPRAAELIARQQSQLVRIKEGLKDLADANRPSVLYLNRFSDSLTVGGAGSYNDFYIRLAGGTNVASSVSSATSAVTIEQILVWNPDVVLLGNFDKAMPSDVYDDPQWQSVNAVKFHRVYRVPLGGYRWDPPSQESALTWTWLAALLHPDRIDWSLRNDMRDWYRFLYDHELADDEIDGILSVKENGKSAGYLHFDRQ
jgi:iron complex transport system substrate-binding protein